MHILANVFHYGQALFEGFKGTLNIPVRLDWLVWRRWPFRRFPYKEGGGWCLCGQAVPSLEMIGAKLSLRKVWNHSGIIMVSWHVERCEALIEKRYTYRDHDINKLTNNDKYMCVYIYIIHICVYTHGKSNGSKEALTCVCYFQLFQHWHELPALHSWSIIKKKHNCCSWPKELAAFESWLPPLPHAWGAWL